jgi:hypothetical protein
MAYYLIRIPRMNYFCCIQILPRVSLVFLLNNKDTKFFKRFVLSKHKSHHLLIKNNLLKIFKNSKIGPKIGVLFYFWKEVRSRSYSSRSNFYYYYYFFAFQCMGSRPHSTFCKLSFSNFENSSPQTRLVEAFIKGFDLLDCIHRPLTLGTFLSRYIEAIA